jgi:hypothetical protein
METSENTNASRDKVKTIELNVAPRSIFSAKPSVVHIKKRNIE